MDWLLAKEGNAEQSAIMAMRNRQSRTKVWLYQTDESEPVLIGFGSLGRAKWNWPEGSPEKAFITIIPNVGIRRVFWGQPPGPRNQRIHR